MEEEKVDRFTSVMIVLVSSVFLWTLIYFAASYVLHHMF